MIPGRHLRPGLLVTCMLLLAIASGVPARAQEAPAPSATEPAGRIVGRVEHAAHAELEAGLRRVQPLLERYGNVAMVGAATIEGMGIPAPGQTLLIATALEAAKGGLNIVAVLALALVFDALGNIAGYLIGRSGGQALLGLLRIDQARRQRIEHLYARYGGAVVVFGRFVDGLRQLNGIVAGTLAMPWWRFNAWNLLGALLWVGVWGLGAYVLERDVAGIVGFFDRLDPWALVAAATAIAGLLIYVRRRRIPDRSPPPTR